MVRIGTGAAGKVSALKYSSMVYYRLTEMIFARRFEVLCADPLPGPVAGRDGERLEFVDESELQPLFASHGRYYSHAALMEGEPGCHRVAVLRGANGDVLSCGYVSGRLLGGGGPAGREALRVPWEGGLDIELCDSELYLWSFWTPPGRRGRGHYASLLRALRGLGADIGARAVSIYCRSDNAASLNGILRAGFERWDRFEMLRVGQLRFVYSNRFGKRWFLSRGSFALLGGASTGRCTPRERRKRAGTCPHCKKEGAAEAAPRSC